MDTSVILLLGAVIVAGVYITSYNGLVHARQKVKEAWSGIDVQLKRRYDLIPNLVKTVQGYASHEKTVLEEVTKARSNAISVPEGSITKQAQAENTLSSTLKSIFALSENYPDLKANINFLELQKELRQTEDQISSSRRIYNSNVTILNVKIQSIPSNIVANLHHFSEAEFFELDELEKEKVKKVPDVSF